MSFIPCGFRHDVVQKDSTESACCELLKRLFNDEKGIVSRVDRSACEYCWAGEGKNPERMLQVIGSAVLSKSVDPMGSNFLSDQAGKRLVELANSSIGGVAKVPAPAKALAAGREKFPLQSTCAVSVDVVLPVTRDDRITWQTINAWMRQENVYVVLHLVLIDPESIDDWSRYRDNPSIRIHNFEGSAPLRRYIDTQFDALTTVLVSAQYISKHFETPFLAFGTLHSLPHSKFLAQAASQLVRSGKEWYAASLQDGEKTLRSMEPDPKIWRRTVQLETAVIRRSLWIDLNGMADREIDADVDFFDRVNRQRRHGIVSPSIAATIVSKRKIKGLGKPPSRIYGSQDTDPFELYREGIGFGASHLSCDVVLPFFGQLQFVKEAIESVLSQTGINLTLHLIDDATPGNTDDFLRTYIEDPRVRIYRNEKNLGQFISFNNVEEYFETDWIVTQDGDDLSLPGRLVDMVRIGELCDADMVGGATILYGQQASVEKISQFSTSVHGVVRHHRLSYPPHQIQSAYFLENPTVVHRRSHFLRMNGFADFGHPLRNRTSVDSEYMIRALLTNANIVAVHRLGVCYRVHPESAVHSEMTRIGSPIRNEAQQELNRRIQLLRLGGIAPHVFGALRRHRSLTHRWKG